MKYVWDTFLDEYRQILENYPLYIILKAFWHYDRDKKDCETIFINYDKIRAGGTN